MKYIKLTGAQAHIIVDALRAAADAAEDIDSPDHYSADDLAGIAHRATGMRALATWLSNQTEPAPKMSRWNVAISTNHAVSATNRAEAIHTAFVELVDMGADALQGSCNAEAEEGDY